MTASPVPAPAGGARGGFHLLSDLPVRHFRTAGGIDPLNTGLQVVGKFIWNALQILFKAVNAAKPLAVEQDIFD